MADPSAGSPGNITQERRPPQPGKGKPSGPFFLPDNAYRIVQRQPYYKVQIWRVSDGQQWRVMDANLQWHEFGDFVTSISTSHHIGDAAGQFSIGVVPMRLRTVAGGPLHTWGELIKPMDYIEITLARKRTWLNASPQDILTEMHPAQDPATGISPPGNPDVPHVVIRGFVTNVRVVDTVDGQSGQPRRRVMINGMNFGKLWLMYRMYLLQENVEQYTNKYGNLFTKNNNGTLTPAEFFGITYGAIFRPQLSGLAKTLPVVLRHGVYCDVPSDGRYAISANNINTSQTIGPLDSFVRQYANTPYTEFYTYDEPWPTGKPITIWRWAPLLDRANRFPIASHVPSPPRVREVHAYEITEHDLGNSDNYVYTYYYAAVPQSFSLPSMTPKMQAPGYLDEARMRVYGFRPFEPPWGWTNIRTVPDPAFASNPNAYVSTVNALTNWLASVFEHNVDNVEGQIVCNGRPDIHCGEYLDVPESGYRYYVETVSHELVVGQSFSTTLSVTRGLPMRDLPNWLLPPGHEFDPLASGGQPGLNGTNPSGGYTAPGSNGVTPQPVSPSTNPTNTKPTQNTGGSGGGGSTGLTP